MNLTERAKRDTKNFSSNKTSGPGIDLFFTAPTGEKASIVGMHTKHNLGVDEGGSVINNKTVWVSFAEDLLKENNPIYPVRNTNSEVTLKKHLVDVKDSTGVLQNYIVQAAIPDEKLGYILLNLSDYKA